MNKLYRLNEASTISSIDKLKVLTDEFEKQINISENFAIVNGQILNAKEHNDKKEFLNQVSFGVAHKTKTKNQVTMPDGTFDTDERIIIDYSLSVIARNWGYWSNDGWIEGGWLEFNSTHLDHKEINDSRYTDLCRRMAKQVGYQIIDIEALLIKIDKPNDKQVYTTHYYNPTSLSKKDCRAIVPYDFTPQFDLDEWRMFEWLETNLQGRYRLSMNAPTDWVDRYPYPMIKSPRQIFFEFPSDASLFKLKFA